MLHIHLIVLGKLKESFWREAEAEYLKRLGAFAKVAVHELKEIPFTEKDPVDFIKQKEGGKIVQEIEKLGNSEIIVLDEHGKQFSSTALAHHLSVLKNSTGSFIFILGGPLGLDPSVRALANLTLSLSPFTFTHQMARVILLEQLYRAMMIEAGRTYHY